MALGKVGVINGSKNRIEKQQMTDFYNTDIKTERSEEGKRIGEKFREEGKACL